MNESPEILSGTDWLAFQYLADELSETDRQRYEESLALDQDAREAVARMVLLTESIATVEASNNLVEVAGRDAPPRRSSMPWWIIASTACLVGCLLLLSSLRPQTVNVTSGPLSADDYTASPELAFAWANAREKFSENHAALEFVAMGIQNKTEIPADKELPTSDDLRAPSWMIAAVAHFPATLQNEPNSSGPAPGGIKE